MLAVRATFDGQRIVLPDALRGLPPQEVILVYAPHEAGADDRSWLRAQEETFAKVWDNEEDAAYDSM